MDSWFFNNYDVYFRKCQKLTIPGFNVIGELFRNKVIANECNCLTIPFSNFIDTSSQRLYDSNYMLVGNGQIANSIFA